MSFDPKSFYNCAAVDALPYKGAEILFLVAFALYLLDTVMVTFLDLTVKQLMPGKFLDPAVIARVADIRNKFPSIVPAPPAAKDVEGGGSDGEAAHVALTMKQHTVVGDNGEQIPYDAVCSMEAYVASKSIDDDLTIMLANNKAFSSISGYCSSTVRGYALLSSFLIGSSLSLAFFHVHNAIVDPRTNTWLGTASLVGYLFLCLTGIIMTFPSKHTVYRQANICLVSNIPLKGAPAKLLKLHIVGVAVGGLVPLLSHVLQALAWGAGKMPNYHTTMTCSAIALFCAAMFGVCQKTKLAVKLFKVTPFGANALAVLFELLMLVSLYIEFLQFEYYATAVCAGQVPYYNKLLMAAMFIPFGTCLRHQGWSPVAFTQPPSVMLMHKGQPVATSGPCPALAFDQMAAVPHVKAE
jgi:hypothetical protein